MSKELSKNKTLEERFETFNEVPDCYDFDPEASWEQIENGLAASNNKKPGVNTLWYYRAAAVILALIISSLAYVFWSLRENGKAVPAIANAELKHKMPVSHTKEIIARNSKVERATNQDSGVPGKTIPAEKIQRSHSAPLVSKYMAIKQTPSRINTPVVDPALMPELTTNHGIDPVTQSVRTPSGFDSAVLNMVAITKKKVRVIHRNEIDEPGLKKPAPVSENSENQIYVYSKEIDFVNESKYKELQIGFSFTRLKSKSL